MRKITISPRFLPADAHARFFGENLTHPLVRELNFTFVPREHVEYRTAEGKLVALQITNVFSLHAQASRHKVWSQLKSAPRNRPEIFGKGARQLLIRKDGRLTRRVGVPVVATDYTGGLTDMVGPYRYMNRKTNKCALTEWTLRRPDAYLFALAEAARIGELYKHFLPNEYITQKREIDRILEAWFMPGTVFTNVYGIKNHPTAVHIDTFDIPSGTGVITTSGNFVGNEFCLPEFGLVFDLQPSDLLFVDVHRLHGNLPKLKGERVGQVYFVRKDMHKCGRETGAVDIPLNFVAKRKRTQKSLRKPKARS